MKFPRHTFRLRSATLGLLLALVLPVATAWAAEAIDNTSPQALIQTSSQVLMSDLDANRVQACRRRFRRTGGSLHVPHGKHCDESFHGVDSVSVKSRS